MIDLVDAAIDLQNFFENKNWSFCIIGGFALQHWGEPRLTRDIDVTLLTGFEGEDVFISEILSVYAGRIPNANEFAQENRVLLVKNSSGIPIDISLGGLPFEEQVVSRSQKVEFLSDKFLRICSKEDLIVLKVFAGRPIDWQDIESVISRQGKSNIDSVYIETHLKPLLEAKGDSESLLKFLSLLV